MQNLRLDGRKVSIRAAGGQGLRLGLEVPLGYHGAVGIGVGVVVGGRWRWGWGLLERGLVREDGLRASRYGIALQGPQKAGGVGVEGGFP